MGYFSYFTYTGFCLGILSLSLLFEWLTVSIFPPLFIFTDLILFFRLVFLAYFLTLLFFLFHCLIIFNSEKICSEARRNPNRTIDQIKDHHAIIIALSTKRNKKIGLGVGTDLLIKKFIRESIPYNVYICNPSSARSVIFSENTKNIYLFGHGTRGNLTFYFEGREKPYVLYYRSCINSPKKNFIAQLHCNSGHGLALCDILIQNLNDRNCFILTGRIGGINFTPDIWLSVRYILLKKIPDLV